MGDRAVSAEPGSTSVRRSRTPSASSKLALDAFFATLREAPARALLLDFDGTLAPFRGGRALSIPHPGVPEALAELVESGGTRLSIVSGRPARDLEARTDWLAPRPELWGSHGLERLTPDGRYFAPPVSIPLTDLLDQVGQWMEERGWSDLFERKPYGFALHERPDPERFPEARHGLLEWWRPTLVSRGLAPMPFDGGLEFRPAGTQKGSVVEALLSELPPGAAVAYLGDDRTDEDAFRALRGLGLRALVRERRRPSEADVWLKPPDELIEFLRRWAREARGVSGGPKESTGRRP